MNQPSKIVTNTLNLIYPVILVFGIYVIINGHITPGGGFQGGAVLAGVFIIRYFTDSSLPFSLERLNQIEKFLYLLLLTTGILYSLIFLGNFPVAVKTFYLSLMNFLIGVKVFCGLTIIFFRFILFEAK
ncbi:sodium:proton antiporter [Clostridiales bacterium COT073_COT-073]|nr:sodium:proton antiporter [Clostridiales bacterium COT073_COT-073]